MEKIKRLIVFTFLFSLLSVLSGCGSGESGLAVDVLPIGKADCIVLQQADKVCMIDTGEEENLTEIMAFLKQKKIDSIDLLIITHFDKDHVGGAAGILENYPVGKVYLNTFEKESEPVEAFFAAMDQKGIVPVRLDQTASLPIGEAALKIYPPKEASYDEKEDNNSSLVVLCEFENHRMLFCGDAMETRIAELLEESIGKVDYMKVPYHGRELDNLSFLLEDTAPQYAVITCSKKNPPSDITLSELENAGAEVFLTTDGGIHASVRQSGVRISRF